MSFVSVLFFPGFFSILCSHHGTSQIFQNPHLKHMTVNVGGLIMVGKEPGLQKSPIKYKPYCPGYAKRGCKQLCIRVGPLSVLQSHRLSLLRKEEGLYNMAGYVEMQTSHSCCCGLGKLKQNRLLTCFSRTIYGSQKDKLQFSSSIITSNWINTITTRRFYFISEVRLNCVQGLY